MQKSKQQILTLWFFPKTIKGGLHIIAEQRHKWGERCSCHLKVKGGSPEVRVVVS